MNEAFAHPPEEAIPRFDPVAIIAVAQLLGTSLWFSANSAADDLRRAWGASVSDIGILTSAVQLGFILGTLVFALSGLADRFPASRIFSVCALLGATFNACFAWLSTGIASGAVFRFAVGICLAGIYPIGMKLIVSWVPERTGSALAYLVAMLTLGTALPHALRLIGAAWKWQYIIGTSSALAVLAALLIHVLGDGPNLALRRGMPGTQMGGVLRAFASRDFRAAALGYFGHMWELYAFWTIIPLLIVRTSLNVNLHNFKVSGLAFAIISAGALGCVAGGLFSRKVGQRARGGCITFTFGALLFYFRSCLAGILPSGASGAAPRLGSRCGRRLASVLRPVGSGVPSQSGWRRSGDSDLYRLRHHHRFHRDRHRPLQSLGGGGCLGAFARSAVRTSWLLSTVGADLQSLTITPVVHHVTSDLLPPRKLRNHHRGSFRTRRAFPRRNVIN